MDSLNNVGIIGAGIMGSEIALCFASSGCRVLLKDTTIELVEKAKTRLATVLDKAIAKNRLDDEKKDLILDRIVPCASYEGFGSAELVIEAVFEKIELKKEVLGEVDKACKPGCILATNTSSIPITLLATSVQTSRRPNFIGAHFFAPASIMKLVEVIPGLETSDETLNFLLDACRFIEKSPVNVKDTAGFVVNRILFAIFNEAVRLVDEGVATCEDIDTACKLGLGHPIGPLALMDMADLGMALDIGGLLRESHGERFRFGTALRQRVHAGHLGRKTGKGWHVYTG
jgi:3-hydroxybutyryl-CoA dehydrogenase